MTGEEFKSLYDSIKPALIKLDSLVYPNSLKEIIYNYELKESENMQLLAKAYSEHEAKQEELRKSLAEAQRTLEELEKAESSLDEKIKQSLQQVKNICIEAESKWPIFHLDDDNLHKEFKTCFESSDLKARDKLLFKTVDSYCDSSFWNRHVKRWEKTKLIKTERIPLLKEALMLYNLGYYFGATSILVCQIYGIASDISSYLKDHGYKMSETEKQSLSEHFDINYEDIDKEKGQLLQSLNFVLTGSFVWGKMFRYLKEEILCSSDSKKRWATQPLRNKICHGDQLNFGTKEHALKALLIIDMLICYARAVEEKVSEENETESDDDSKEEMV